MKTFFGFRNGKLVTVVQTTDNAGYRSATDVDYTVEDPQEAERQIVEWIREKP